MRVSKKFPTAVHSLLYVAVLSPKRRVTSTLVAESTGSNAVTIRNIFLDLSKNGLLTASAGKNGGVHLAKEPKDITLWDIYQAVETNDVEEIFKLHETDSTCPVGKNIYQLLYPHMLAAVAAMRDSMEQVTLQALLDELKDLLKQFRAGEHTDSLTIPPTNML
ncbi:MAG: Rrf2 family transcriptional regulator [Lachnospiraceae bacterium]|nr:Rrf2 family transcriptional regulator [Oscillospiraceae bacterium]MCD7863806.1 Rrf2 family transcriptional regulator [Lachnospiraceae bacterium]